MDQETIDEFKNSLPKHLKKSMSPQAVTQIATTLSDPDMHEMYRDNLLSYVTVMSEGKFKVINYVNAVKYVSHRLAGMGTSQSYDLTFPGKFAGWKALGKPDTEIAQYVYAYNKTKLVTRIYEQSSTPLWLINQDNYQKAINIQVGLMTTAQSETVQMKAADSLLTHLKPPEVTKHEIKIDVGQDSMIEALRASTEALVEQQSKSISSGAVNAQQIAHTPLTLIGEGTFEDVTPADSVTVPRSSQQSALGPIELLNGEILGTS